MHFLIGRCVCSDCTIAHFESTHIYQAIPSHPNIPSIVTTSKSPLFVLPFVPGRFYIILIQKTSSARLPTVTIIKAATETVISHIDLQPELVVLKLLFHIKTLMIASTK